MTSLFTDNFRIVSSDRELDKLKAQYPTYDHYYLASGSIEDRKALFEKLWAKYEPYADSNFLKEVKTNFHSRSWEMYLTCVFLDNGLVISSSDTGPDIKITIGDKTVWIECVAPTSGEGKDRVPEMVHGLVQDVPVDKMALRLSSALEEKFQKYQSYLEKKIVADVDMFIIAINRGAFSFSDTTAPLIFKCLFGLGDLTYPLLRESRKLGEPYFTQISELKKASGNSVPMKFFDNRLHEGISAVIYSKSTVLNHPDKIGSDCLLVHNPLAKTPLPEDAFPFLAQHKAVANQIVKI